MDEFVEVHIRVCRARNIFRRDDCCNKLKNFCVEIQLLRKPIDKPWRGLVRDYTRRFRCRTEAQLTECRDQSEVASRDRIRV